MTNPDIFPCIINCFLLSGLYEPEIRGTHIVFAATLADFTNFINHAFRLTKSQPQAWYADLASKMAIFKDYALPVEESGVAVFYVLPARYHCQGSDKLIPGNYFGSPHNLQELLFRGLSIYNMIAEHQEQDTLYDFTFSAKSYAKMKGEVLAFLNQVAPELSSIEFMQYDEESVSARIGFDDRSVERSVERRNNSRDGKNPDFLILTANYDCRSLVISLGSLVVTIPLDKISVVLCSILFDRFAKYLRQHPSTEKMTLEDLQGTLRDWFPTLHIE